ncbi:hypothetical protein YB2330_001320 [Saitoella coloradoensis]
MATPNDDYLKPEDAASIPPRPVTSPSLLVDSCMDHDHRSSSTLNSNTSTRSLPLQPSHQAETTLAPFLSKHIPQQGYPEGAQDKRNFCYRHNPSFKCRRQAHEPTMGELQAAMETLPVEDQQAITHVWSIFSAAPATHRRLMLSGILSQCCFPQLSFISSALSNLIRIDFITALPAEISFKILSYLDPISLCRASMVCREWKRLADDDVVWHRMCEQHIDRKCEKCGWGLPLMERRRLEASKEGIERRRREFERMNVVQQESAPSTPTTTTAPASTATATAPEVIPVVGLPPAEVLQPIITHENPDAPSTAPHTSAPKRLLADTLDTDTDAAAEPHTKKHCPEMATAALAFNHPPPQPATRPWKDVYSERCRVERNWRRGRCTTRVFRGHTDGIMCLQFDDRILATGSYDTTIRIWDLETGREIRVLRGHVRGVRCLIFDDNKLISGSMDRTIRVWNRKTGECICVLGGHTDGVVSLHFDDKLLASGSADSSIKIWNFETKECFTLRGHRDWVNSVKIHSASQTLYSASDDTTVKMWDLRGRVCLRTFTGHVGQVQNVLPITLSQYIDPDEIEVPAQEAEAEGSEANKAHPRHLATSSLDNTIKVWDVRTGACVKTFFGHVEGVWALAADKLRLASGAHDRLVKIWDWSGKCEHTLAGHTGPVTCVGLGDSKIVSGSDDGEARLFDFGDFGGERVDVGECSSATTAAPAV